MPKKGICVGDKCYIFPATDDTTGPKVPLPTDNVTWTVYGATWCGFCRRAKQFLEKEQQSFIYYDVDKLGSAAWVKKYLTPLIGDHNTVPIIFNGTDFVGGFSQLEEKYKALTLLAESPVSPKSVPDSAPDSLPEVKMGTRVGGMTDEREMVDEVKDMVEKLKSDILSHVVDEIDQFTPTHFATQVVAGVNYFVRVKLTPSNYAHVRIYQPLPYSKNLPSVSSVLYPKEFDEPLEYF